MNNWIVAFIVWVIFSIALALCSQFGWGVSFTNDIALFVFCAPVVIPIFIIGIPIALCIRFARKFHLKDKIPHFKKRKNKFGIRY